MRTSLDLPDDLLREAKIVAVQRGVTLRALMAEALEKELHPSSENVPNRRRVEFPIIRTEATRPLLIRNQDLIAAEAEDDLKRSGLLD